jgi:hypothetical protein
VAETQNDYRLQDCKIPCVASIVYCSKQPLTRHQAAEMIGLLFPLRTPQSLQLRIALLDLSKSISVERLSTCKQVQPMQIQQQVRSRRT